MPRILVLADCDAEFGDRPIMLDEDVDARYARVDADPQASAASETGPTPLLAEIRSSIRAAALLASAEASCRAALNALARLVARAARAARPAASRTARSLTEACRTAAA